MKILSSEITPYKTYLNRRKFIKGSLASALMATVSSSAFANHNNKEFPVISGGGLKSISSKIVGAISDRRPPLDKDMFLGPLNKMAGTGFKV